MDKSVDKYIFINNMSEIIEMTPNNNDMTNVTDHNIRLMVQKYYTPQVDESSKGIILRFVPNRGNVLPEAIVWFEKGKKGFVNKPLSQNVWMMVDCDLRPLHELLHKHFHLSEGDFNITRTTLSSIAYETISEWAKQS
jgi:hypothetical protein